MAGDGGEAPLGGQGGVPTAGAAGAGAPNAQGGAAVIVESGMGLSLPGSLKFDISCGVASVRRSLSLTNWSESAIEITAGQIAGAYTLETSLPLTVAAGESVDVVVSTAPGVVGTDAPGDERQGTLTLTSNLGSALIHLEGAIGGAILEIDSIPGAPLVGPLAWACASTAEGCGTKSFTIVNKGAANAVLHPPVGDLFAVAAFVPGSQELLTLEPGAAIKVEVRPAANEDAPTGTVDAISILVEGSCDLSEIAVPVLSNGLEDCPCDLAPPGIEASQPALDYTCGADSSADLTIFNGSAEPLDVTSIVENGSSMAAVKNTLPFRVDPGQSGILQLVAPPHPGNPGSYTQNLLLGTNLGSLPASTLLRASGGQALLVQSANLASLPSSWALNDCGALELAILNYASNGPVTVQPPIVSGGVSLSGFAAPQTLQPGEKAVFSVAAVSNGGNACAGQGSLEFALGGDCRGAKLTQSFSYAGSCTCNGI
ncbi:MAG TPA: hypothetical protein VIW29_01130 [Polyangiaceae bacterium]